jgi:hypothetical protein
MDLNVATTALRAGRIVGLPVPFQENLKIAHQIADILAARVGAQLGRIEFVDSPMLIIWLPGTAPDPFSKTFSNA